jgi:hypothetical protein
MRKSRCDAAQPKCGLCATQNVDCVYRDARQPKIDYNTQVLLERMQLLEDRLLSASSSATRNNASGAQGVQQSYILPESATVAQVPVLEGQIPLSHTANANHVFSWPLVQELLSEASKDRQDTEPYPDATDIFFLQRLDDHHFLTMSQPPSSWKLFDDKTISFRNSLDDTIYQLRGLIDLYFAKVNIFFPLLLKSDIIDIFNAMAAKEGYGHEQIDTVEMPQYGLLLVVLCLALLSSSGQSNVRLDGKHGNQQPSSSPDDNRLMRHLWDKARLVLGYIPTDMSLTAAQGSMLAR